METVNVAKVAVSAAPYAIDKPYDYAIPTPLLEQVVPGVRVTVPFGRGNKGCEGVVLAVVPGSKTPALKLVTAVLDRMWLAHFSRSEVMWVENSTLRCPSAAQFARRTVVSPALDVACG